MTSLAEQTPRIKERDFQRSVMELAELSGWQTLHVRTSMQAGRYLTATTGTMAKGWPDLVLVHPSRQLVVFVELKADRGKLRVEQSAVIALLRTAGCDVRVWKPKDWPLIEATLTHQRSDAA